MSTTYTWISDTITSVVVGSDEWSSGANWSPKGPPVDGYYDSVVIGNGVTVIVDSSSIAHTSFVVEAGGSLEIETGVSPVAIGGLTVNGGTVTTSSVLNSNSTISITNGGNLTFSNVSDSSDVQTHLSSDATGVINFDNSSMTLGSVSNNGINGNVNISNGSSVSTQDSSTNIYGTISVSASTFVDRAQLNNTSNPALILNAGATVTLSTGTYPSDGAVVDYGTGNSTLILPDNQYAANKVAITNLKAGDSVGVDGQAVTSATLTSDNIFLSTSSVTITAKSVAYASSYAQAPQEGTSVTIEPDKQERATVCFLAGSLIHTPSGAVAIESLSAGDELVAYVNGAETIRCVVWAGQAHCTVRPHLPDDEAGWPVRILKDAIADGAPCKDMLITAEHSLFFNGRLVPARMLVNGRSIFYDKSITSYDYYHVETEQHSIIMADGMLTESYLDTGNRRSFQQNGKVVSLGGSRNLSWANDAAAPLGVSREFVEPLFRQAEARAKQAAIASREAAPALIDDADLHLETDNGMVIRSVREANGRVMFMIPTGVKNVRIVSHASRPSDVIGPFVDDRRYFGVAVGEIMLFEAGRSHMLTAHLTEQDLDGWNTLEWEDTRWTSGSAFLPLGKRHPNSVALLAVQIKKAGPYLVTDTTTADRAITA